MAIVRLAPPFDAFHGTVSGQSGDSRLTIFSTSKSAGVSRKWVVPANPQSTEQMRIRSYQIAAAAAYKALTPEQAALWIEAAEYIDRQNILHLSYRLSGINLFTMINVYRQIAGAAIISDVPAIWQPPIPTMVSFVIVATATSLAIRGQAPGAHVGQLMMVRVSRPLPSAVRKAKANDVRLIGDWIVCIEEIIADVVDFTLVIVSGEYAIGDRVGVELTPLSSAYFPGAKYLEPNIAITAPV